jgi:hypothetical protein
MEEAIESEPKRTLLPRFTIRVLLALITICAFIFVVVGMAARGQNWAWGVSIAFASLVLTALVHAAWFGIVWMFAKVLAPRTEDAP